MTKRTRSGLSRRAWIVLVLMAVAAAAVVLAPRASSSAELQLVVLDRDGRFRDSVAVGPEVEREPHLPGAVSRVPLVLGIRNAGEAPARPSRLELSVPERVRLTAADGRQLAAGTSAAGPLVRYAFEPEFEPVAPGRLPELLPGLDTLWVEVVVPFVYCIVLADSVPEFIPAPFPDPETLRSIRVFYAFEGGDLVRRQTGILTLALDEAMVQRAAMHGEPTAGPPGPAGPMPDTTRLERLGERTAVCGDPAEPTSVHATVWRTPRDGRFIVLASGGVVRKHLYDLDGDGILEREAWDGDGDGRVDRGRTIRLPIPEMLLPRLEGTATATDP